MRHDRPPPRVLSHRNTTEGRNTTGIPTSARTRAVLVRYRDRPLVRSGNHTVMVGPGVPGGGRVVAGGEVVAGPVEEGVAVAGVSVPVGVEPGEVAVVGTTTGVPGVLGVPGVPGVPGVQVGGRVAVLPAATNWLL